MQGGVSTKSILDHSLSSGEQYRTLSPCDSGALAPLPLRACSGVSACTRWSWGKAVAPAAGSLTAPHTPLRRVRHDHLPHRTTALTGVQLEAVARVVGVTRAVPKQVAVLQGHTCAAIECMWLAPAYASISRDVQGHNSAREGARNARFLSNSVSHMGHPFAQAAAAMCRAVTCSTCGKMTWAGCGMHIEAVRVPSWPLGPAWAVLHTRTDAATPLVGASPVHS